MTIVEQGGGPAPQAAPDLIKETTTQTFVKDVIEESKRQPVLIDFWAPWCGPCQAIEPVLEEIVAASDGGLRLVKLDIDANPGITSQFGIRGIPTLILFKDGKPHAQKVGALSKSQLAAFVDSNL